MILDQMLNVVHQRGNLAALFIEGGSVALADLSASAKLGIYRTAWKPDAGINQAYDIVIGFYLPSIIVSATGNELVELQKELGSVTLHEALAIKEGLEPFLDSSERWEYVISKGLLFWWGEPDKSTRRKVTDHLDRLGYRVNIESSYTGLIHNRTIPTILPDASGKTKWYKCA